nr:uncharacterized protein LOC124814021 [Hydra vulgaris]
MNSRGGGVCIYVNDLIDSFEVNNEPYNNKDIDQIWCTIKMSNECILCGCIYRPGSDDLVNFQNVINSIKENLVFTASPFRISSLVHKDPLGKTKRGHHVLNFNFNYQLHNRKNESITTKRVYMKGNYHEFSKYLNKFNWSHEFTGLNVDQCYESFIRTIEYGCKDFIPSFNQKTTESKRSLWMNKELKHEIRLKQSKKNPKQVYAYINSKLKAKDHIRAISIENNEISTDSQVIANQLNRFFNSVFINESLTNMPTCENIAEKIYPTPLFNEKDIKKRLLNLNVHKSPGIDRIHPMFLSKCADSLVRPLCMIFNQSFLTGTLPTSWLEANITPIFKNGDRLNAGNYRPISLTSVVCKVMESIVKDTIMNHLNKNKLLIPEQHGFIKSKNCVTNLLETLDIITEAINCRKCVDVAFLDFSKAFDSVPHSRLLLKLKSFGIVGKLLQWCFLANRKQRVVLGLFESEWETVRSGTNFNKDKCKIMHFGRDNQKIKYNLKYNATETKIIQHGLIVTSLERDLGVYISDNLKWEDHIEKMI